MNNKLKTAIATVALLATLAACSSSDSADSVEDSADTAVAGTESTTQVTVEVDQEIKDALNVEAGSAVIPGSIEIVPQELGEECTKAVAPLREIITKFPSVRQVDDIDAFNKALQEGKLACEASSAQEWSDFYTKEVAGWIYAKTDNVVEAPVPAPETIVDP